MKRIKALWARIPARFRKEIVSVAKTFVEAFVGTFLTLVPGVLAAPNFEAVTALGVAAVVASAAAGARAARPAVIASVRRLFRGTP